MKTILGATAIGASTGAIGGGYDRRNLNVSQEVNITVSANYANKIVEQLGAGAVKQTVNADGSVTINILQSVIKNADLTAILAGAGIGALIGALGGLIIGEDRQFEPACISLSSVTDIVNNANTLEEAQKGIQEKYPDNRGLILAALAEAVQKANSSDWKVKFLAELTKMGGKGSVINCEEMSGNKFEADVIEDTEVVKNIYAITETEAKDPQYSEDPVIRVNASCSSWRKLIELYPNIQNITVPAEYRECNRRKHELPIRMLKVAQAITDGDYSLDRLLKLAEQTFASKNSRYENVKDFEGINHDILVKVMNANAFDGEIKLPNSLGGINRNGDSFDCDEFNNNELSTTVKGTGSAAQGKMLESEGEDAKYYLRYNNGDIEEFTTAKERQGRIDKIKEEDPGVVETEW